MMLRRALSIAVTIAPIAIGCSAARDDSSASSEDETGATANVLTQHNDNARSGGYLLETKLTLANVRPGTFGKKMTLPVDGEVYAQVLYTVSGTGLNRNVAYVATMNNSVYAFDADTGQQIWTVNLGGAVPSSQVPTASMACGDITDRIGITSTPVIDPAANAMYLVAKTGSSATGISQSLVKLDIRTGKTISTRAIAAQVGDVTFDPTIHLNRAGLLLSKGNVYIAFAGHCDQAPYHGWVMSYDAGSLTQSAAFVTTPTGTQGGIWMAGAGLDADAAGNVYFMAGNGTFDRTVAATDDVTPDSTVMPGNVGSSYLKLTPDLKLADFFTPSNVDLLNPFDIDVGSGGLLLIPGTNLLTGGTKEGVMYVVNGKKMGRFTPTDISREAAVQRINDDYHNQLNLAFDRLFAVKDQPTKYDVYRSIMGTGLQAAPNVHTGPAYFSGPTGKFVYIWTEVAHLKAFKFDGQRFDPTPLQNTNDDFFQLPIAPGMPGGFLSVSANGQQNGILWATHPLSQDANVAGARVRGILRAYDASDIRQELWNSQMNEQQDQVDTFAKFVPPTIANGKVFVPTFSNEVLVYGLK